MTIISVDEDVEKPKPLRGNSASVPLKVRVKPSNSTPGTHPREMKTYATHQAVMFTAALATAAKGRNHPNTHQSQMNGQTDCDEAHNGPVSHQVLTHGDTSPETSGRESHKLTCSMIPHM